MTRRTLITCLATTCLCPRIAKGQASAVSAECSGAAESAPPGAPAPGPQAPRARGPHWRDLGAATLALAGAVAGLSYILINERRRPAFARARTLRLTPYVTGALLGLLVGLSLVALGHPVGVSGAMQHLAGWLGHKLTPGVHYWGDVIPIGLTWQALVAIGLVLGSLGSAALAGRLRLQTMPQGGWAETFGPSRVGRWLIVFFSAALLEFAAAVAGGCTSGLALSGGITFAPAAYLFMAAMFAGGIPTAWLLGRLRSKGDAP